MATNETLRFWRAYKDQPNQWEEVSREYVLEYLDGPYRDPQAALHYLIESGTITTPFAIYRAYAWPTYPASEGKVHLFPARICQDCGEPFPALTSSRSYCQPCSDKANNCQSSTGTPVRDWCQVHGFNTQKCRQPA